MSRVLLVLLKRFVPMQVLNCKIQANSFLSIFNSALHFLALLIVIFQPMIFELKLLLLFLILVSFGFYYWCSRQQNIIREISYQSQAEQWLINRHAMAKLQLQKCYQSAYLICLSFKFIDKCSTTNTLCLTPSMLTKADWCGLRRTLRLLKTH